MQYSWSWAVWPVLTSIVGYILVMQSSYGEIIIKNNEKLESAVFYLHLVPISVLDLCGSILVCLRYRTTVTNYHRRSWLETLMSCSLMQFGGTTLTGWLLGQTPSWIISHNAFPALVLAWWLTFYCPGDVYHKVMSSQWAKIAILPIVTLLSAVSAGHAVTSWGLDKALNNTFHTNAPRIAQSALTCIFAGTLSASGGGILADCLSLLHLEPSLTYTWRQPSLLRASLDGDLASRAITKSFFLATLYYMLRLPAGTEVWKVLYNITPSVMGLGLDGPSARAVVAILQLQSVAVTMVVGEDPQYTTLSRIIRRAVLLGGDGEEHGLESVAHTRHTSENKAPATHTERTTRRTKK